MPITTAILVALDRSGDITRTLKELAQTSVMVGIPSDQEQPHFSSGKVGAEQRTDTSSIGNAALGYIHETGSPLRNIPARPFLQPGVRESAEVWGNYLKQAGDAALSGNKDVMDRALHAAGQTAVSAVKNKIAAGIPPPLKQSTVRGRQRRHPSRVAASPEDTTPLIDTGQLVNSISYVLRKKKS